MPGSFAKVINMEANVINYVVILHMRRGGTVESVVSAPSILEASALAEQEFGDLDYTRLEVYSL